VHDGRRFSERWLAASPAAVAVRVRPHQARHRNKRRHGFQRAALTPTADTNTPGRCCTQVDTESVPCQAMDGAGHFGCALQAKERCSRAVRRVRAGDAATPQCPLRCRRANADTPGNRHGLRMSASRSRQDATGVRWTHVNGTAGGGASDQYHSVVPVDDLPIDVLTELGRVTWAAIKLEDYVESVCSFIEPANPRTDMRQLGQKIKDAQKVLTAKPVSATRDQAKAWLERARQAIEQRNAALHATPVVQLGEPQRLLLGEMPRKGRPYFERPLTVEALGELRSVLESAADGWRELVIAVGTEFRLQES
jgi:hypothetical protein